jgi:hypothetical protein
MSDTVKLAAATSVVANESKFVNCPLFVITAPLLVIANSSHKLRDKTKKNCMAFSQEK